MATLQSWRKAYGAIKDTTKVGLAHVNSDFAVSQFSILFLFSFSFSFFFRNISRASDRFFAFIIILLGVGRCCCQSHQPRRASSQRQTPSKCVNLIHSLFFLLLVVAFEFYLIVFFSFLNDEIAFVV